jgi:hypothetical protein
VQHSVPKIFTVLGVRAHRLEEAMQRGHAKGGGVRVARLYLLRSVEDCRLTVDRKPVETSG